MSAEAPGRPPLPSGTVTFLLTDVAGSTALWTGAGPAARLVARQAEIIAEAIDARGGIRPLEQGEGDSVVAVFERASDALQAAVHAQLALTSEPWDHDTVRVRMAIHTGEAEFRDGHTYGGAAIIRCARLRDLAAGGQVLVSSATAELSADRLPDRATLVAIGEVELRGLARPERVHQLVHQDFCGPVAALGRPVNRLGSWPTPLIGRVQEQRELLELLRSARLVTITGPGGAGKTRLAHAVATELCTASRDVVWVDLARVPSAADLATTVAQACGVSEAPGIDPADVLVGFLQARDTVVVLDTCEHLLDGCAALVSEVLRRTSGTRFLATTREPLGIAGEMTWRIPSLHLPPDGPPDPADARCDAARLFADRARAADPAFALDDTTIGDVITICRQLDGLPLPIELAAARLRSMTLQAIRDGLGDRFRLLTGGSRTALRRQQTLLASVEWSYELLDGDEQDLLRRLAVFLAPFTVEAAEAVASHRGDDRFGVFDVLSRLVDKSLVVPAGERYRLLETIRQFALQRAGDAGELPALRDRHRRWFESRATRWAVDREILTETTLEEIGVESADLLGALEWSLRSNAAPAVALLWPLGQHWSATGSFAEATRVANEVLARYERASPGWFDALAPLATTLVLAGAWSSWVVASSPAAGDASDRDRADTRNAVLEFAPLAAPTAFSDQHRFLRLRSLMERARDGGNRQLEFGATAMLAYAHAAGGALDEAARLCEWLDRHLPADATIRSMLDVARSYTALHGCDFAAARQGVASRARHLRRDVLVASLAGLVGTYTHDRQLLLSGLEGLALTPVPAAYGLWNNLLSAVLALLDGRPDEARTQLDAAQAAAAIENQSPLLERLAVQLALTTGDIEVAAARAAILRPLLARTDGRPYPSASLHLVLADVAAYTGRPSEAEREAHDALRTATAELPLVAVDALELLAVLLAGRTRTADAGRLVGAADAFRKRTGYRFRFPARRRQLETLRPLLDPVDVAAGAHLSLPDAVALAQGAHGKRGRPPAGWDSLTPTEARIVNLVADGLTNAEIGDRLFVGLATVKTHLVHVYDKLGLRSRAELVATAARRQLPC